jgi:hypothetical protein
VGWHVVGTFVIAEALPPGVRQRRAHGRDQQRQIQDVPQVRDRDREDELGRLLGIYPVTATRSEAAITYRRGRPPAPRIAPTHRTSCGQRR